MTIIIGIDPSVRATAIVAVPLDWGGDWSKVRSHVIKGGSVKKEAPPSQRVTRNMRIAEDIHTAVRRLCVTGHLFIEGYSFGSGQGAHFLGELGGEIRRVLHYSGETLVEVAPDKARKTLLGKVPRANKKAAVQKALMISGARFGTIDEYDAMCIANHGLSEHGGHCFIGAQT